MYQSENFNTASRDGYIESSQEEDEEEEEENVDTEDDYSEDDCFTVEVESEAERKSRDSSDESDMAAYAPGRLVNFFLN